MAPASRDDADGLPLEQVVGPRLAAGRGHPAVRLDDPRPGPDEEERRLRLAVRRLGEQEAGTAARGERLPDVAVRRFGTDQEAGPVGGLAVDPVELAEAVAVRVDDGRCPPVRALFTYWRHFLRRSPQSASSSGARSMTRVALGWIGGAGRQPASRSARRKAPSGSSGPFGLDLRVDPQVADPPGLGRQSLADCRGEGRDRVGRPVAGHRARAGRRRSPTASADGRRTRIWAPIGPSGPRRPRRSGGPSSR